MTELEQHIRPAGAKMRSVVNISASTCIEALANSFLSRRQALQAEIAVGLVIFAAEGDATKDAKRDLRGLYASAGYFCFDSKGGDYKNINKRVNTTAALFAVLTRRAVRQWIGEHSEAAVISAVMVALEPYQFATMDDVLEYCARPNNRTARQRANDEARAQAKADAKKARGGPFARRSEDIEGSIKIDTAALHIVIPPTATPDELREVAAKLLDLANAVTIGPDPMPEPLPEQEQHAA